MKARKQDSTKVIAEKRIKQLFELANKEAKNRPAYARRYIEIAREIARKSQTKIPLPLKRSFCKKCNLPFFPSTKIRTKKGFVIYTCGCGARRRFKIKRKN